MCVCILLGKTVPEMTYTKPLICQVGRKTLLTHTLCCKMPAINNVQSHQPSTEPSFSRKILPNSEGQFAKFRDSPQQNCSNSAAYRGLPFVRKLSSTLLKKLHFFEAGMVLSYASNIQKKLSISIFFSKLQFLN